MAQFSITRTLLVSVAACGLLAGCGGDAATPNGNSVSSSGSASNGGGGSTAGGSGADREFWPDYPDAPYVPIMQDVDGIPIPRLETETETLEIGQEIPVDVGNEHAGKNPSQPTTGDWVIASMTVEPKSMNPIVETSAVQTYVCNNYVFQPLAVRNMETLEYEPMLAERWVAEDAVKLSPDYPEKQRRITLAGGEPQPELEIEYEAAAGDDEDPPTLTFHTSDGSGRPLGNGWVGLFPVGKIVGAPSTGYHFWSNDDGRLEVSELVPGKYRVRVGAEVFGKTTEAEDGSLTVEPVTPHNPLERELQSSGQESLKFAKEEWIDLQRESIYTCFLRKDAQWSDGTPYTSKDLEFAHAVINNPFVDGESVRVYYSDVILCEGLDPHTVRVKYRQQYFLSFGFTADLGYYTPPWHLFEGFFREQGKTLTMQRLTPAEEEQRNEVSVHGQVFGKFFNTDDRYNLKPLGTGPYVFDKWIRADRSELVRNPDYWDSEGGGFLDRIIFKYIPDQVLALQALKAGEIDFLYRPSAEQYHEDLAGPPNWVKQKYVKADFYIPGYGYFGWNLLKPIFQDRRVRIALSLLFDLEDFVEKKLHGAAVLVSGSQYYFGLGYDHEVKPVGYDPETAADLLADAGWVDTNNDGILDKDGQKLEITLLLPPGSTSADARAALMQKSYKQAGIQMHVRYYEWASFIDKIKSKDFDVVNLMWVMEPEGDPYQLWHSSGAGPEKRGSNHVSFADPLADELIEMIRVTLDKDKRQKLHYSFHRVLDREQPYLFLYTPKDYAVYHNRFRGVKWYRLRPGFDLTKWYVPKDEQLH